MGVQFRVCLLLLLVAAVSCQKQLFPLKCFKGFDTDNRTFVAEQLPADETVRCAHSGSIILGNVEFYQFVVPEAANYDILVELSVPLGDVDLAIIGPQNQLIGASIHAKGVDRIFVSRHDIRDAPGKWHIKLKGYQLDSEYSMVFETYVDPRNTAPAEQDLLDAINDACCTSNACVAKLQQTKRDACHQAPNICGPEGNLLELYFHEAFLDCGGFPAEFGQFPQLEKLSIRNNKLNADVADVADVLMNNTNLHRVDLTNNEITGSLGCEFAEQLTLLNLGYNLLEGELPKCLMQSPDLHVLVVTNNSLSGEVLAPHVGSNITIIHAANQNGGGFTGELPSFSHLEDLVQLDFRGNSLEGPLPKMPESLNFLDLGENQFSGEILGEYRVLTKLLKLQLDSNQLEGGIPAPISNSVNLVYLDASNNQLSGGLPTFAGAQNISVLKLSSNAFEGEISQSLGELPWLQFLWLDDNDLSGTLEAFSDGVQTQVEDNLLFWFNASGNQLTGDIPAGLSAMALFREATYHYISAFDVSGNDMEISIPDYMLVSMNTNSRLQVGLSGNSEVVCPEGSSIDPSLFFDCDDGTPVTSTTVAEDELAQGDRDDEEELDEEEEELLESAGEGEGGRGGGGSGRKVGVAFGVIAALLVAGAAAFFGYKYFKRSRNSSYQEFNPGV